MPLSETTGKPGPGFFEIFRQFFGISALTIGGGYVMVPVIQRAVERRGWLSENEFYDLFAAAQSVPGPLALNAATFVGRRVAGAKGYAAAFLGIMLPPFASVLLVASVFDSLASRPVVAGFLDGAFAAVPGLTAALAYKMIRKRRWNATRVAATVAGAVALILAGAWAVPVFFALAAASFLLEGRRPC